MVEPMPRLSEEPHPNVKPFFIAIVAIRSSAPSRRVGATSPAMPSIQLPHLVLLDRHGRVLPKVLVEVIGQPVPARTARILFAVIAVGIRRRPVIRATSPVRETCHRAEAVRFEHVARRVLRREAALVRQHREQADVFFADSRESERSGPVFMEWPMNGLFTGQPL